MMQVNVIFVLAKPENEEGDKKEEEKKEEDDEEDDEMPIMPSPPRVWDPDKTPFQAILEAENIDVNAPANYYVAPPESTKKDIELLQDLDTRKLAELMEVSTSSSKNYFLTFS